MSGQATAVKLDHRGVLAISGPERRDFLQGIVSNDVTAIAADHAIWTALLTPQGKFLHEFFLVEAGERLLIDCEAERREDLKKRLSLYKLRAKAEIEDLGDSHAVAAFFGADALSRLNLPGTPGAAREHEGGSLFVDPRLAELGARAILPKAALADLIGGGFSQGTLADYDAVRLPLGVPDGSRDLEVERATLLEAGFDELGGLDWNKGCYMGQELTARMRYRGLVKRRLVPVALHGPAPEPGTQITLAGKDAGTLHSASGEWGLALLRVKALDEAGAETPLMAGKTRLDARPPAWLKLESPEEQA